MSLLAVLKKLVTRAEGPTSGEQTQEMSAIRQEWRERVHESRNEMSKSIAAAHILEKKSKEATSSLRRLESDFIKNLRRE